MEILLIDVDSYKLPNLALMKLSSFFKDRGHEVFLNSCSDPDLVFVSCIYPENEELAYEKVSFYLKEKVRFGGTGISLESELPEWVEHVRPDYSLYGVNFSMGFTSRGCIRNCPWCIVPEKEGKIRNHAPIWEFLHPDHDELILLDNNFLASPKWRKNLEIIRDFDLKVNFNQGLDIRLIDEEKAGMLADIRYYDWKFDNRRLHFAFDLPELEEDVRRGVQILKDAGIPPNELMFYELVGFNTDFEEDMHRFRVLEELGVKPYVMRYNDMEGPHGILKHFDRWVNRGYYRFVPWEEYDHGDSQEAIAEINKM